MRPSTRLRPVLPTVLATTALVLVLLATAALTGCAGSGNAATTTSTPTTTAAPTTTSTEAETTTTLAVPIDWGKTATWEGVSLTANAPTVDPLPESVDTGDQVVYCLVKLVNNTKDPYDYNGLDFSLYDTNHQEYDAFGLTSMPDLGTGTLAPGESAEGAVAFEMPSGATPGALVWQPESAAAPQAIWGTQ